MKYQSPFKLFEELGIDRKEVEVHKLPQLEKRLLLELELTNGPYLQLPSGHVTKNDVLNLFEQLKTAGNLEYHLTLHEKYPQLLTFLVSGEFDERRSIVGPQSDLHHNDDFRRFVSPYLKDIIRKQLNFYFNQRSFRKAFRIVELTTLLSAEDRTSAFDKLAGSVNQLLDTISALATGDLPIDIKKYAFLHHDHFILFMNELPEEFTSSREKLAIKVNNLGVQFQEKELKFIYLLFMALRTLKCSEYMYQTIYSNGEILSENYRRSSENDDQSEEAGCSWVSLLGLIPLLLIILRACNG